MSRGHLLDWLPSWLIFVGTAALVLLSIYGGSSWPGLEEDPETSVNTIVGAVTALLAFLLAFTFGLAASRFDAKRTLLLDEVNAIGTTFLRTGLIPEPHGSEVRALLREYVEGRMELARHPKTFAEALRQLERLQGLMWSHATALAETDLRNPGMATLFVSSLNEMFDLQTKRTTVGAIYRMPSVLWIALYALTVLTMLEVGYLLGLSGRANWLLVLMLSLALSTVITLIVDLDRSRPGGVGLIAVELQPMTHLRQSIQEQMDPG